MDLQGSQPRSSQPEVTPGAGFLHFATAPGFPTGMTPIGPAPIVVRPAAVTSPRLLEGGAPFPKTATSTFSRGQVVHGRIGCRSNRCLVSTHLGRRCSEPIPSCSRRDTNRRGMSARNSSLVNGRRKRFIVEAPRHHIRPQPRKSRAVATSLVSLPNPEEGEPLPTGQLLGWVGFQNHRHLCESPWSKVSRLGNAISRWFSSAPGLRISPVLWYGLDNRAWISVDHEPGHTIRPEDCATGQCGLSASLGILHHSKAHPSVHQPWLDHEERRGEERLEEPVRLQSGVDSVGLVGPGSFSLGLFFLFLCWSWFLFFFNWFSHRCQPLRCNTSMPSKLTSSQLQQFSQVGWLRFGAPILQGQLPPQPGDTAVMFHLAWKT